MKRVRDVAARYVLVAVTGWLLTGSGCVSHLDQLRARWASIRSRGGAPCGEVAACHALIDQLDRARREACGTQEKCEATDALDREIRAAVLDRFKRPCEQGEARACVDSHDFGFADGLREACDLGLAEGCIKACRERGGSEKVCAPLARDLKRLTSRCKFKRGDRAEACRGLGILIRSMSGKSPPHTPPSSADRGMFLYATPWIEGRGRCRYALDYFSRACHLGDATACRALCERRADERGKVDLAPCRRITKSETAKSLWESCRKRNGRACHDLALLSARMGFFDRDPAGFFITGPGRIVGLDARACQLGVKEACHDDGW